MHGSSEISLESLEYLPRCVFLGKPWIPSSAKPVKAPLSFLASLQHLLSGFSAFRSMLLRIQHTLGGQSRAARRARSLRFLFIWVLHLLAALVFQNSSFCLPSPVDWHKGWDVALLASVPCAGGRRVPQGGMWGPSQCGPLLYSSRSLALCLQVAGVFFPFVSLFCILCHFYSCFQWEIWSDIAAFS